MPSVSSQTTEMATTIAREPGKKATALFK